MTPTRRQALAALLPPPLWAALWTPPSAHAEGAPPPDVARGVDPRPLVFPRDHGAHPDTRTEWWYITGELSADSGDAPTHGFQVTFFRSRTDVGEHPSRFAARQLLFAHAAVTDLGSGRLLHDQRIAREGFGVAQASRQDTRLVLRDWTLARRALGDGARYQARIDSVAAGFAFELDIDTTQPMLLQGEDGYSRKGPQPGQASHYYSQPQLRVAGRLRRDGRWAPVHGRAWLDHEWSETLLHPEALGWDWIGMNLDDGSALTAFRLRRADGGNVWSGGSFRPVGTVKPQVYEGPQALRFTPLRHWRSPATGTRYPVDWAVQTPDARYEVRALADGQELDSRGSTGSIYWEGLSALHDARGRRIGSGYLEMTGYAARLQL